eukprot:1925893-Rhodomonas_salina.1
MWLHTHVSAECWQTEREKREHTSKCLRQEPCWKLNAEMYPSMHSTLTVCPDTQTPRRHSFKAHSARGRGEVSPRRKGRSGRRG